MYHRKAQNFLKVYADLMYCAGLKKVSNLVYSYSLVKIQCILMITNHWTETYFREITKKYSCKARLELII